MAGVEDFRAELVALGCGPEVEGDLVRFDYPVPVGSHRGETARLAFRVPPDWPMSPPSGPLVSPRFLPINPSTGQGRPFDAVHEGSAHGIADPDHEWEYWSRPYPTEPGWGTTDKTVRTYMAHIRTLFDELPDES